MTPMHVLAGNIFPSQLFLILILCFLLFQAIIMRVVGSAVHYKFVVVCVLAGVGRPPQLTANWLAAMTRPDSALCIFIWE
jgi:hypothetical protein